MKYRKIDQMACSITSFGCFCYCDETFTTAITPTISGLHTIEYNYNGHIVRKRFSSLHSGTFELPNVFNEDGKQFFKIKMPNGEYFTYNGATEFYIEIDGCSDAVEEYKYCDELFDCNAIDTKVDCLV